MLVSYHVHSKWSDGKSSLSEIIEEAKRINLDEIGISDHLTISPSQKYEWSMPFENLEAYISEVNSFSKKIPVKLGLEADFFPETVNELEKILRSKPFDYVIGSVHFVKNVSVGFKKEDFSQEELDEMTKNYWDLVRQMAESRVFDIVGHVDLFKEFGFQPKTDLSSEIDLALEAIKSSNMCIELNTSGWHKDCREQYPSVDLLKKCKKKQIPVIVSADAHDSRHLIRNFKEAFLILSGLGFKKQPFYKKRKCYFSTFPSL